MAKFFVLGQRRVHSGGSSGQNTAVGVAAVVGLSHRFGQRPFATPRGVPLNDISVRLGQIGDLKLK